MPMFQRRHYEAVARALGNAMKLSASAEQDHMLDQTQDEIAKLFKQDNDRFDPERFDKRIWQIAGK